MKHDIWFRNKYRDFQMTKVLFFDRKHVIYYEFPKGAHIFDVKSDEESRDLFYSNLFSSRLFSENNYLNTFQKLAYLISDDDMKNHSKYDEYIQKTISNNGKQLENNLFSTVKFLRIRLEEYI